MTNTTKPMGASQGPQAIQPQAEKKQNNIRSAKSALTPVTPSKPKAISVIKATVTTGANLVKEAAQKIFSPTGTALQKLIKEEFTKLQRQPSLTNEAIEKVKAACADKVQEKITSLTNDEFVDLMTMINNQRELLINGRFDALKSQIKNLNDQINMGQEQLLTATIALKEKNDFDTFSKLDLSLVHLTFPAHIETKLAALQQEWERIKGLILNKEKQQELEKSLDTIKNSIVGTLDDQTKTANDNNQLVVNHPCFLAYEWYKLKEGIESVTTKSDGINRQVKQIFPLMIFTLDSTIRTATQKKIESVESSIVQLENELVFGDTIISLVINTFNGKKSKFPLSLQQEKEIKKLQYEISRNQGKLGPIKKEIENRKIQNDFVKLITDDTLPYDQKILDALLERDDASIVQAFHYLCDLCKSKLESCNTMESLKVFSQKMGNILDALESKKMGHLISTGYQLLSLRDFIKSYSHFAEENNDIDFTRLSVDERTQKWEELERLEKEFDSLQQAFHIPVLQTLSSTNDQEIGAYIEQKMALIEPVLEEASIVNLHSDTITNLSNEKVALNKLLGEIKKVESNILSLLTIKSKLVIESKCSKIPDLITRAKVDIELKKNMNFTTIVNKIMQEASILVTDLLAFLSILLDSILAMCAFGQQNQMESAQEII